MTDFSDDELHTKPVTFMGAPYTHDFSRAKAGVLGVPFDCGIHPFRIGSRQGPAAIRAQSILVRRYSPELADVDPVERLGLVERYAAVAAHCDRDHAGIVNSLRRRFDALKRIADPAWRQPNIAAIVRHGRV